MNSDDLLVSRDIRYEGVIFEEGRVLVLRTDLRGRSVWLLPGGGREADESEVQCVQRELWEETGLLVEVGPLLYDLEWPYGLRDYRRKKAYLCRRTGGVLAPGVEPEVEFDAIIAELAWLDLSDEHSWPGAALANERTVKTLRAVRQALGIH